MRRADLGEIFHQHHAARLPAIVVAVVVGARLDEAGVVKLPVLSVMLVDGEREFMGVVLPVAVRTLVDLHPVGQQTDTGGH